MLGAGAEQLYVFAVFFVHGVGISAFYMFFLGLTRTKLAAVIFDSLFGAAAIYLTWKLNLEVNNGEFRAFLFVAIAVGCAVTYLTCKRTLDKLSSLLYNLFTEKLVDKSDGKSILQKINGNTVHSGNTGGSSASLRATDNSRSDVRSQRTRGKTQRANRRGKSSRRNDKGTTRVPSNGRLREKMGRSKRTT